MILVYVNLINYMDRSTVAGMLEKIKQDKDFNIKKDKYLGLLQTAFVVCYMIFAPVFGYLGDRYSRKWLLGKISVKSEAMIFLKLREINKS